MSYMYSNNDAISLLDLIGLPLEPGFVTAATKRNKQETEEYLCPVEVFFNGYVVKETTKEFFVSIGIFKLDKSSVTATVTRNNQLKIEWAEKEGKGRFTSFIPSNFVTTGNPVLSYDGGVLDVKVPIKLKAEHEEVFVGKLF